jgi:cytochrome c peroxidase
MADHHIIAVLRPHPAHVSLVILAAFLAVCAALAWLPRPVAEPQRATTPAELGRHLFYDRRLSADERRSCASCHRQELGFSDGLPTPIGLDGTPLHRNSPGLFNAAELATLTWADPRVTSLEQQVAVPLFATHPREMGVTGNEEAILTRLRADPATAARFAAAFPGDPDPVRWARVVEALAAFTRSLEARKTAYDRYVYSGDVNALSPAAVRGMRLFFSAGLACGHCHTDVAPPEHRAPPRWADLAYLATGAGTSDDQGLAEVSGQPSDAYRFRVPPLRNVAVTAPYMHDGSLPTLGAVLRFYESGGRDGGGEEPERRAARHALIAGFVLGDAERADLLAFLDALTDTGALHDPRYADPAGERTSAARHAP